MSVIVRHFVKEPKVLIHIESLDLSQAEKDHLQEMAILLYHQKLLNRFLEYLQEEDKKVFLEMVLNRLDENYLEFLHQRIENLEAVVSTAIVEIEQQILEDIDSLVK